MVKLVQAGDVDPTTGFVVDGRVAPPPKVTLVVDAYVNGLLGVNGSVIVTPVAVPKPV